MLSAQGDSSSSKTERPGERRFSWGMVLLGAALLVCALLLFYYARSNTPETVNGNVDNGNLNLNSPANATGNSQTAPSSSPKSNRR